MYLDTIICLWYVSRYISNLSWTGLVQIQNTSQVVLNRFSIKSTFNLKVCIYTWSSTFTEHKSFHSSMVWAKSTMQRGTLRSKKRKKEMKSRKMAAALKVINYSIDQVLPWLHQFGRAWRIGRNQRLRIPTSCQRFRYKVPENTAGKYYTSWHIT